MLRPLTTNVLLVLSCVSTARALVVSESYELYVLSAWPSSTRFNPLLLWPMCLFVLMPNSSKQQTVYLFYLVSLLSACDIRVNRQPYFRQASWKETKQKMKTAIMSFDSQAFQ